MDALNRTTLRNITAFSAAALAGMALVVGCGEDEAEFDRGAVIEDMGTGVIMPTVNALHTASQELHGAAQTLCADPSAVNLDAARDAWLAVKAPLKRSESFSFGPARVPRVQMSMNVDKWPGRGENIEAALDTEATIDEAYLTSLDYRDRVYGFPAAGYLLFGAPEAAADTLAAYTDAEHLPEKRCEYLLAVTDHAAGIVAEYHTRWSPEGGGYLTQFVEAGSSDAFPSEQDAFTAVTGTMLFALVQISEMKLGVPLMGNEGAPMPEEVEAPYSNTSVDHALWAFEGVERLYLGSDETMGLSDYVQFRQAAGNVDQTVRERITAARSALEALNEPLAETVVNDADAVQAAIDAVDQLNQAISGEVSTLLGINPTTVEGDND
ncbi:hypothetical protein DV096_19815 [Bradymonadaceae bacterium TMQ3]|nr:hypothetical protein DV096_19815 [Bradymonadaceae bacterium TMQ3]TXC67884.1 imelysin family protein [Bradymonadales bacterium TMQ1]